MDLSEQDTELLNGALTVAKRTCRRMGRPGMSGDDLFAEVGLMAVYEAWQKWKRAGSFTAFATRRLEWRIKTHLKAFRKRQLRETISDPRPPSIHRLMAIWKRIAYGKTQTDIAKEFGINVHTVKYYVHQIKKRADLPTTVGLGAVGRVWGERNPL